MTFISYAQNFEDVILWRALKDVERGFYIDVGAWDPNIDSVTRAFSERGWNGINIEPLPDMHARLQESRPNDVNLAVAVGHASGSARFFEVPNTGLSTFNTAMAEQHARSGFLVNERTVETTTLAQVCRLHCVTDIHFLKLDCEGHEAAALSGFDFVNFRPWIVLAEATIPGTQEPSFAEFEPLLLAADYRFAWFDGLNRFYVAAEHFERLAALVAMPPNIFDNFTRLIDLEASLAVPCNDSNLLTGIIQGAFEKLLFRSMDHLNLAKTVKILQVGADFGWWLESILKSAEFRLKRKEFIRRYMTDHVVDE
jgi:FkbM family methyltransferase